MPTRGRSPAPPLLLLLLLPFAGALSALAPTRLRPSLRTAGGPRACAAGAAAPDDAAGPERGALGTASDAAATVYKFSRPHTIRGTLLACITGVGRALYETPAYLSLLPSLLPRAMLGVLALLLGNLFIVGINQIYDVEIDEVNKPFLPIAAGSLSRRAAWAIVLGAALGGLTLVRTFFSTLIFRLYLFGTTIGGLYSVPPVQLKRFPLAAGFTIACCRGFLLNFGVYYATREARPSFQPRGRQPPWPPATSRAHLPSPLSDPDGAPALDPRIARIRGRRSASPSRGVRQWRSSRAS